MMAPIKYKEVFVRCYHYENGSTKVEMHTLSNTSIFDAQMDMVYSGRFKETPWYKVFSKKNKMELFTYNSPDSIYCYDDEEWVYTNKNNFKQIW